MKPRSTADVLADLKAIIDGLGSHIPVAKVVCSLGDLNAIRGIGNDPAIAAANTWLVRCISISLEMRHDYVGPMRLLPPETEKAHDWVGEWIERQRMLAS